jgi:hypothetical protein
MGFLQAFMTLAKSRSSIKGYEVWRMGYINQHTGLTTYFHWRYFSYWRVAIKVYKELLNNSDPSDTALKIKDNGYQVIFTPEGQRPILLTTIELRKGFGKGGIFRARMMHTFPGELKKLIPYLSKLFDAIKNYPKAAVMPEELKKMIAHFFWMGVHNTITERGNSQYMLMLHRLLYNLHGFQTGPWNPLYVQPDCIALLLPFEQFYQEYYDHLFDYQPVSYRNLTYNS